MMNLIRMNLTSLLVSKKNADFCESFKESYEQITNQISSIIKDYNIEFYLKKDNFYS